MFAFQEATNVPQLQPMSPALDQFMRESEQLSRMLQTAGRNKESEELMKHAFDVLKLQHTTNDGRLAKIEECIAKIHDLSRAVANPFQADEREPLAQDKRAFSKVVHFKVAAGQDLYFAENIERNPGTQLRTSWRVESSVAAAHNENVALRKLETKDGFTEYALFLRHGSSRSGTPLHGGAVDVIVGEVTQRFLLGTPQKEQGTTKILRTTASAIAHEMNAANTQQVVPEAPELLLPPRPVLPASLEVAPIPRDVGKAPAVDVVQARIEALRAENTALRNENDGLRDTLRPYQVRQAAISKALHAVQATEIDFGRLQFIKKQETIDSFVRAFAPYEKDAETAAKEGRTYSILREQNENHFMVLQRSSSGDIRLITFGRDKNTASWQMDLTIFREVSGKWFAENRGFSGKTSRFEEMIEMNLDRLDARAAIWANHSSPVR